MVFDFQVLLVIGGQAPKAIRSVECYDFKEEKWSQLADMPSRRCRCGMHSISILSNKPDRPGHATCEAE